MAKAKVKKPKRHVAEAVHLKHGDNHIVGLKALRVLLMPDGDGWFAQGLEIDYAASGATLDEVKENFGEGLALTVGEHLRMHGTIEKLLKVAPQDAWLEYLRAPATAIKAEHTQITGFERIAQLVEKDDSDIDIDVAFPFTGIEYLERVAA